MNSIPPPFCKHTNRTSEVCETERVGRGGVGGKNDRLKCDLPLAARCFRGGLELTL